MFKKLLVLMVVMFVVVVGDLQAVQIAVTWDGGGDGQTWEDQNNWDPNIVPNNDVNTFVVTINSTGVDEVGVGLQQSRTIDQLDCYGNVWLEAWTSGWVQLTVINGLTNYGDLELEDIEIDGIVTNTNGATLELFEAEIDGDLYNLAGAVIEAEGENDVEGDLQNAGTLTILHASDFLCDSNLYNTGVINLYSGECGVDGIVDNNSTGIIQGFGVIYAGQLLHNKGQIYAYGGSLAISCEGCFLTNTGVLGNKPLSSLHIKPGEDVNNQGTIEVHSGGGVAFDCNLVNDTNGIINLYGGTLAATTITQSADANFAGFGGLTVADEVLIESGAKIELTGPTNIVGDVNIPTGATLEISDGQTLITGHTTCDGTIHLIGGTVVFQGGCDCEDCNIINEAGIDRNHFDLNADGIEDFKDFAYFAETWLWQASWYQ